MAFMEQLQHLKIELEEIKLATENFGDSNVIGKGGFGKVYKGELSHSNGRSMVAFKRLDRQYGQGDPEFLKEIMLLSSYSHENLISLLGFCNENGEKILVYEYASRGSLDRHLSDATLTWSQRLKICLAAAKGLSYLQEPNRRHQRVLHCDIKSANILLDENWIAKVSDFGLSKMGPADQRHTFLITNVIGTIGYCDPMFMETYTLTKESDVYSFGVVLLEVLCGRLCFEYIDNDIKIFVTMWKQRYEEKNLDDIIFEDLKKQMDLRSLESFSDIAYNCLKRSRDERPTMSQILQKLELALKFQEIYEGKEQPTQSEKMIVIDEANAESSKAIVWKVPVIVDSSDLKALRLPDPLPAGCRQGYAVDLHKFWVSFACTYFECHSQTLEMETKETQSIWHGNCIYRPTIVATYKWGSHF